MYINRDIELKINKLARSFPVVAVLGARQVGKTTLLRHLANQEAEHGKTPRVYVSLDDPQSLEFARNEPQLFLERYRPPIIIDEAQKAPELFPYIKIHIDEGRFQALESGDQGAANGLFWLTGSQPLHLRHAFRESLAGRIALIEMYGLSQTEIARATSQDKNAVNKLVARPFEVSTKYFMTRPAQMPPKTMPELYESAWLGSYPYLIAETQASRDDFYSSYLETYLLRDVEGSGAVLPENEGLFTRFLQAAAAMTGLPVNFDTLAQSCGISPKTAKRWIHVLVASHIVALVAPFSHNAIKRLAKTPTLHFLDTGLASYLSHWPSSETLMDGAQNGHILESFAYAEMLKSWANTDTQAPGISFFRTGRGAEIDFVLESNGVCNGVEVKRTARPTPADARHMSQLVGLTPPLAEKPNGKLQEARSCILCLTHDSMPITKETWAFPLWAI